MNAIVHKEPAILFRARAIIDKDKGVFEMDYKALAKDYQDQYLDDLNTLVSVESTRDVEHAQNGMPFGPNVRKALDSFLEMAKRDGFKTKDIDGYAGVVEYGDGEESVGVLGHLDIVPLGEGWTKDPLKVTVNDGYVFGRGVMDDKGPLLAGYYALKMLKDNNIPLKRKVMIIAGCDEESGMECMKYYKEHGEIPTLGFTPDADFPVIYGEKGHVHVGLHSEDDTIIRSFHGGLRPNIVIADASAVIDAKDPKKDLFEFYLKTNGLTGDEHLEEDGLHLHIKGTEAHGAMPFNGNNAAVHLFNFIGQAYDDQLAKDFYILLKDWKGSPEGIHMIGAYMGFLTMNPGIVDLQDGKADVMIDIRYPNDTTPEKIIAGFEKACHDLKSDIVPTLESSDKPLFVDPDSDLVKGLMASYRKNTGDEFTPPITIGGGTYARQFDNFVAFGPEKPNEEKTTDQFVGGCHQKDEGMKVDDLIEAMGIYADAIENLAG